MFYSIRVFCENARRAFRLIKTINYNSGRLLGPISIQIGLTTACNYKCYFCRTHSYLKKDDCPVHFLPNKTVNNLIEDIEQLNIRELVFSGNGEPFLHSRLPDMIERFKQRRIKIVTNGSMLDNVSSSMFENISNLTISLNTINRDLHPIIHGYNSASKLPNILTNIERFVSLQKGADTLQIHYCLSKNNFSELEELFRLSSRWNVFFAIKPTEEVLPEIKPEILSQNERSIARTTIKKLMKDSKMSPRALASLRTALYNLGPEKLSHKRNKLLPCYAGFYMPFIIGTGDYNICCYSEKQLGNINQQRFLEIWRSSQVQERLYAMAFMNENNNPVCQSCFNCKAVETHSKLFHSIFSLMPFQIKRLKQQHRRYQSLSTR